MNDAVDNGKLNNQGSKVPFGVNFIRKCILIIAILLSFWVFFELIFGFSVLSPKEPGRTVLVCVIYWIIFYGLKKVKSWVVILSLIFSYFAFLFSVLAFFQFNIVNGEELLQKFFQMCFIFLFAFQIVIFSRFETKRYFKEKGTTLI